MQLWGLQLTATGGVQAFPNLEAANMAAATLNAAFDKAGCNANTAFPIAATVQPWVGPAWAHAREAAESEAFVASLLGDLQCQ